MRANLAVRRRVAERVKTLRLAHGWSQEQLAERIGNSQKHISLLERAKTNVGVDVLASIAHEFAVDITDLFGEDRPATAAALWLLTRDDVARIEAALRILARAKSRRSGRTRS